MSTPEQRRLRLFTVLVKPSGLLQHFVRHYEALGYTDWHVAVHARYGPFNPPDTAMRVHIEPCYAAPPSGRNDADVCNEWRLRAIDTAEWHSIADLDEFYVFPFDLRELLTRSDEFVDYNSISGRFVDRLADDGSLPEIDERPLDVQFPRYAQITKGMLHTKIRKVMLMRGLNPLGAGHHKMKGEAPIPQRGEVHHFKWHAGLVEHLRRRIADRNADEPVFMEQCDRILRHLDANGGKFSADYIARETWIPIK